MDKQQNHASVCKFCRNENESARHFLPSLYLRLKKQIVCKGRKHLYEESKGQGNSFKQLVRILFPSYISKNDECNHSEYSKMLQNKLGVSSQVISAVCGRVCSSIAETNYQLQLIISQVKNVSESIALQRISSLIDSDDSDLSLIGRRKPAGGRRGRKKIKKLRIQSKEMHQMEEPPHNAYIEPRSQLQLSGSSPSDKAISHYGYYVPYPIYFHPHQVMQ